MTVDSGWLKILELKGSKSAAAFLACLGLAYGHQQKFLALEKLPELIVVAASVGTIIFGALTAVWLIGLIGLPFRWLSWRFGRSNRVNKSIDGLSGEEMFIFGTMIANGQRSCPLELSEPAAMALRQKGLLIAASGVGQMRTWIHTISQDVWEELRPRAEEFASVVARLPGQIRRERY